MNMSSAYCRVGCAMCAMLGCMAALADDPPPAAIGEVEYFFNADPGAGNGTVLAVSGQTHEFTAVTAGLEPGVHTLYLRTRPTDGTWGPPFPFTVAIEGSAGDEVPTTLEYAWISAGSAPDWQSIALPPGGGAGVSRSFQPPLDGMDLGTHMLAVRSLDGSGSAGVPFFMPVALVPDSHTGHTPAATALVAYATNADGVIPGSEVTIPLGVNPPAFHSLTLPLGVATPGEAEVVAYLTHEEATPSPQTSASFLIVAEGTNGYLAWRDASGYFTEEERMDPLVSGPQADPDNDGFSNQVEFAFGGNPRANSVGLAPVLQPADGRMVLRFRQLQGGSGHRAFNYVASGVRYAVQFSETLSGEWQEGGSEAFDILGIQDNGDGTDTIEVAPKESVTAGRARIFMRVKIHLL